MAEQSTVNRQVPGSSPGGPASSSSSNGRTMAFEAMNHSSRIYDWKLCYDCDVIINVNFHIVGGVGKRLAFGFAVEKYSLNIDFGPFWIGIEF